MIILHFLYGVTKLAIWCTRKNKVEEKGGATDPVLMVNCFVKRRLTLEYSFYNLTNHVMHFYHSWRPDGFLWETGVFGGFEEIFFLR